jgi:formyl-CoA transferase
VTDAPLADVSVIDLTVARAGPTCVRQLADWGADVIQVAEPVPPGAPARGSASTQGSDFQNLCRNKRALSLDLKQPEGHEILMQLVDRSDVLVENMRPSVKERLGFGWETVHARNPRLVFASLSGFGQDGPYAARGGLDQIVQGMGGLMSVTGEPGGPPTRAGIPVADLAAGLYLAIGVLVALHERTRTGEGRFVSTSLLEASIAMLDFQAARWTIDGVVAPQEGNHHPTMVPMGCFESQDGYVNIGAPSGRLLEQFCEIVGVDLTADERFATVAARSANRVAMNELIAARLRTRPTAEWVARLNDAGVPCGPVYRVDEVFADPQVQHLGMVGTVEHPDLGALDIVRNAVRIDGAPPTVRTPAPSPGEHTDAVLSALGYGDDDIAGLRVRGVI